MTLQEEVTALRDIKITIETPMFQDYIMKPLFKEMESMKGAYSCETLRELSRLKGKREGLQFIIDRIKIFQEEYEMKNHELNNQ